MPKRVYSAISKFKQVEAPLREASNRLRSALGEIEAALDRKCRTNAELALLRSIRDQTVKLREQTNALLHRLYSEVDSC